VIVQIPAHAGQVVRAGDAVARELLGRPDARQHQDLR
jgi:hypothetical protein